MIYVLCGTDADGIARANRLGELIYEALVSPARARQHPAEAFDRELADHLEASRLAGDDWFRIIGGERREGAIIVSQIDEPVDYAPMLSGRVANLVPVDGIDAVTRAGQRLHPDGRDLSREPEARPPRHAAARSARSASPRSATPATSRPRCRRTRSSRSGACASGSSTRSATPKW